MSELLSKISSYNLYNYLLVGFVYNMLLCHYTQLGYVDESILSKHSASCVFFPPLFLPTFVASL